MNTPENLIDPDRAVELLDIAGDIIEAAKSTGDDALQVNVTGYRFSLDAFEESRARLRHLKVTGMEFSDDATDARRRMNQNEQLCAHFLDLLDRHLNA